MSKIKDKKILLTGACGGLGSSLALKLCQKQADVIVSDKNPRTLNTLCDKIIEQGGREPMVLPMDLMGATPNDFIHIANTIEKNIGSIDTLIHAATEFSGLTEFVHYEPTRWLKEMQVNLNSPIFLTQALIPLLQKSKGTIIFTLENMKTMQKAYWGAYGTTKAALKHFAKSLKEELEESKIKVHTITPKPMKTQLRAKGWPAEEGSHLAKPEQIAEEFLKII